MILDIDIWHIYICIYIYSDLWKIISDDLFLYQMIDDQNFMSPFDQ